MLVKDMETLTVGCVMKTTGDDQGYWARSHQNRSCKVVELVMGVKMISVVFEDTGVQDIKRLREDSQKVIWEFFPSSSHPLPP